MKLLRNFTFVLTLAAGQAFAQQQPWESETDADIGNEEVVIVKERENELPPANRSYQRVPPQEISPQKENLQYNFSEYRLQLKPIDPTVRVLTIKSDPPAPYYNRYVKAGLGNYFSTYLDGWISSERNPSYLYSLHLNHRGAARGPVDKGNSGYSENRIEGKASFFSKNATLDGNIYGERNRYNFYGYNEEVLDPDKSELKQTFNMLGANLKLYNTETEKFGIGAGAAFEHTSSTSDVSENLGLFDGNIRYELSDVLGIRLNTDFLMSRYEDVNSLGRNLFRLSPAFRFEFEPIKLIAGFNIAYENDTASNADQMHFYPKAEVHINPAESVDAMLGFEGNMLPVTYRSLVRENPFLNEQTALLHTNKTFDFYGSIKGRVLGNLGFLAGFSAANYKNMYFFVNGDQNELSPDSTRFDVIYDTGNTAVVNVYGELSFTSTNRFQTSLRADYFGYDTDKVAAAWHKPSFKLEWIGNYNLYDKVLFTADAYMLAGITAREIGTVNQEVNLDPVVNLGLGVEYLFSRQASAFLKFDNLLNQEFQRFYNYPSRRLVVTIGGSYAF